MKTKYGYPLLQIGCNPGPWHMATPQWIVATPTQTKLPYSNLKQPKKMVSVTLQCNHGIILYMLERHINNSIISCITVPHFCDCFLNTCPKMQSNNRREIMHSFCSYAENTQGNIVSLCYTNTMISSGDSQRPLIKTWSGSHRENSEWLIGCIM